MTVNEMNNLVKYNDIFVRVFEAEVEVLNEDFRSEDISKWDSVNQMALITEIEDAFDIMLDIEDMLEFTSYEKGKLILKKYEVEV